MERTTIRRTGDMPRLKEEEKVKEKEKKEKRKKLKNKKKTNKKSD